MKIKLFSGIAAVIFAIAFTACGSGGSGSNSTENVYTITFDANNGSGGPTPVQVVDGDPLPNISLQTPPERAGYYFIGYFDSPVGGTMYYTDALTPAKSTWDKKYDTTLYAQWSLTPKVTIIFHKNDGSGETATQSVEVNKATALSANTFSREGYAFKGWSTTQTGIVEYADGASYSAGNSNIDLYAIWTANKYTITFNANGGSGGPTPASVIYGEAMPALIASVPTQTGYYFDGYYDAPIGGTMYYTKDLVPVGIWNKPYDATLYARWTAIPEVTIIFNSNYGSNQTETQNVRENTSISLRENTFARDGYKFEGWATTQTGSVEYADKESYTVGVSTANLYAVWSARQYNVSFDPNNGTGGQTTSVTATYDAPMPSLSAPVPTRTGYYFVGYYNLTSGGQMYYTADMLSARTWDRTSNTTLYAQWMGNTYTVSFNANGGSGGPTSVSVIYGEAMPALTASAPTQTGYSFDGYYDAPTGGTMYYTKDLVSVGIWNKPSGAILYAQWAKRYEIGDIGPGGGKIFYVSENGFLFYSGTPDETGRAHYLEAAPEDMPSLLMWIPQETPISGTSIEIGYGRRNTALILNDIAGTSITAPAASACYNYENNGKADWFLPSRDELTELRKQKALFDNWTGTNYWSSTQGSGYQAWAVDFSGTFILNTNKSNLCSVRPVRAF